MKKDSPSKVIDNNAATGRQLTRREAVRRLLAGVSAGAAWPLVVCAHPVYEQLSIGAVFEEAEKLGDADWKPAFLNAQQDEALVVLAERIVPGSEKARVNRFVDLLLSVDNEKHQRDFVEALAAFEGEAGRRFEKRLTALDGAQVDGILTDASVRKVGGEAADGGTEKDRLHAHFENLKGWISGAYYSSEAGMREMGWTGDYVFASFPGCEHAEGHS